MPTLVLTDVPGPLYDQIHRLAQDRHRSPADTAIDVLQAALRTKSANLSEAPLPQAPFLTEEISAPFDIPWPEGRTVVPVKISNYIPEPHDSPDAE